MNHAAAIEFAELPATAERGALSIEYQWLNAGRAGAPLALFLHEGLGSLAMWRDWPQVLCDRLGMRGLVYSRPGYGRSTPRAPGTTWPVDYLSRQARDVLPALLDALDVDSAFYGWNDAWLNPAYRNWNIVDALPHIRVPLLAVQGYDDHYATMAQIDTIAEHVPQARLVKLERTGHTPHRDAPDALNDAIAAFMQAPLDTRRG
jgi:pimeloyl-ACP methyl ester carboxylesterase